jgi:hypothetical protein
MTRVFVMRQDGRAAMVLPIVTSLDLVPRSLQAVAECELASSEAVLGAVYLVSFRDPPNARSHERPLGHLHTVPGRALIVSHERVLVLDDPADSVTTSASQRYVAASCPMDAIVAIELRSHLLDCAITLVLASPDGVQRVTIGYNGVHEPAVLNVVGVIRAALDAQQTSNRVRTGISAAPTAGDASRRAATELSHRQRYYLTKFVAAGEQLQGFLGIPALRRGRRLQRLSLLEHALPPVLLARTDRQVLIVKHAPRTLRREASYGCDAWLLPLRTFADAEVRQGQPETTIVFGLGRSSVCYRVEVAVPASLTGDAAAFTRAIHNVAHDAGETGRATL